MKLQQFITWILFALVILGGWQLIVMSKEMKADRERFERLQQSLDDSREQRTILIDSLRSLSTRADTEIKTTLTEIERLEGVIAKLRNKPQYDPNIDNMRDNDSIADLFQRFYPTDNDNN